MKSGKLILIPAAGMALLGVFAAWTMIASAATGPTTDPATAITSTDATLNATNGDTAATDSSFWVSTSTFSTASSTLPSGVFSTPDLGAQAATSSFSAALSSATGMPAVTPDTTYNVVAWISTDGGATWTPGNEVQFTTSAATPAAPTITSISPTSGSTAGGTVVTITGTGLSGTSAVNFGGTAATDVTASSTASETSLTATAPSGAAGPVDVTVTTPGGTSATSSADTFTYNAPVATNPVISDISISDIGTSSATIMWDTDQATMGNVAYGTTTSYGSTTALETTASTTHSVNLTNLNEATLYHFQISAGNGTASSTSADQEFTTSSTASTTPLAIDGITTNQSSGEADNSFVDGWQWTIHFTVPTNEDAFRIRFSDWGNASSSFATANDVQVYSAQSSNASSTNSAILETGNGNSDWLYFTGDSDPLTPGRQVDLVVQVKIPFGTPNGSYSSNFTAQTFPSTATSTAQ